MLDGRVKTLHPLVHGGLLYIRGNAEHEAAVAAHGIQPIDMVVVNLYAFEKTAAQPGVAFGHLIENIDIGGPSMVRSAAKNFEDVAIVTSVSDYPALIEELKANSGALPATPAGVSPNRPLPPPPPTTPPSPTPSTRSRKPPRPMPPAAPDTQTPSPTLRINFPLAQSLRYGENPHQRAALYSDGSGLGIAGATQLQGKELSFNNLVDLDACWELAQEFDEPAVIIVKHTNPCGAATGATVLEAYQKALACDPVSAFGGVIGINRDVDAEAAEEIAKLFVEAIAAPSLHAGGPRALRRQKEPAPRPGPSRPAAPRSQAHLRRPAAAGRRHRPRRRIGTGGRHLASAHRRRTPQPALRLARLQARQIQRHRLRPRRPDPRHRRRSNEPCGRRPVRRHEGRVAARTGASPPPTPSSPFPMALKP